MTADQHGVCARYAARRGRVLALAGAVPWLSRASHTLVWMALSPPIWRRRSGAARALQAREG